MNTIQILQSDEIQSFTELIQIFKIVFELDTLKIPNQDHLATILNKPDFLVLVAKEGNKIIGGLTVYILHRYYSTRPIAYIYDFGIHPNYQRKGIGSNLITYLIQYCKENDFEEMYVEAETDDLQAVNFYKKNNPSNELNATHFTYFS